uniref:Uncharacterized protein n=1 Tax=Panagrolaimus sp. ES5 TaxID=591445 RepID=A0AC34FHT6_9BILA
MFKRLRQFFIRRKNKKSFSTKSKYFSPPPSVYKQSFEFPPEPEPSMFQTPRKSIISVAESSQLFESNFQLSRIPTFHIRSESGWQSSKPYSQNATRFRFHSSYNRFHSSKCSNKGGFRSSRCLNQSGGTPRRTKPKPPIHSCKSTPRKHIYQQSNRPKYQPCDFNTDFDISN